MNTEDYAVPSKVLRSLLVALKAEMSAESITWDGSSEELKKYLVDKKLDPKAHSKFQHYFVNMRHTAAVSYTWRGTNLYKIAQKAKLPENEDDLVWIDVLVVNQFSISSSEQVIGTTGQIYFRCKVYVFLDDSYFSRAWCLAETGNYASPDSDCEIIVYGSAKFRPGTDFLGGMDAGVKSDLPLIHRYILSQHLSKEAFNEAIDHSIVRLSASSLSHQGRYVQAQGACPSEIQMLETSERIKSSTAMARALDRLGQIEWKLGNFQKSLELYQNCLEMKLLFVGDSSVSVAATYGNIANVLQSQGKFDEALKMHRKCLEIEERALGPSHGREHWNCV